jgi:hypothetical protein
VLVVIGTCIWFGVQHFGYLDFLESHSVAQRTRERTSKCANDLAIHRATEELKSARDYAQVCDILRSAFSTNDFDGFELRIKARADKPLAAGERRPHLGREVNLHFEWNKLGTPEIRAGWGAWDLTLELSTSAHRWLGSMKIYRLYSDRDLLVDTNLLTMVFPVVLADALDRAFLSKEGSDADVPPDKEFTAAEAS